MRVEPAQKLDNATLLLAFFPVVLVVTGAAEVERAYFLVVYQAYFRLTVSTSGHELLLWVRREEAGAEVYGV